MVVDDHQVTWRKITANRSGRVRDKESSRAQRVHHSYGKTGESHRMSFVHVESAGKRDHSASAKLPGHQRTCVSKNCRFGEHWYVREWNADTILDVIGKTAEARPQDDRNLGFVV